VDARPDARSEFQVLVPAPDGARGTNGPAGKPWIEHGPTVLTSSRLGWTRGSALGGTALVRKLALTQLRDHEVWLTGHIELCRF
jgi:hypothetical protein